MNENFVTEGKAMRMISEAIENYDVKQDKRHRENSDRLKEIITEQRKVSDALILEDGLKQGKENMNKLLVLFFSGVGAAVSSGLVALIVHLIEHGGKL